MIASLLQRFPSESLEKVANTQTCKKKRKIYIYIYDIYKTNIILKNTVIYSFGHTAQHCYRHILQVNSAPNDSSRVGYTLSKQPSHDVK